MFENFLAQLRAMLASRLPNQAQVNMQHPIVSMPLHTQVSHNTPVTQRTVYLGHLMRF